MLFLTEKLIFSFNKNCGSSCVVTAWQWYILCIPSDANAHLKYPVHKYTHYKKERRNKEIKKERKKQTNKRTSKKQTNQ
jgi:hypothetical protein